MSSRLFCGHCLGTSIDQPNIFLPSRESIIWSESAEIEKLGTSTHFAYLASRPFDAGCLITVALFTTLDYGKAGIEEIHLACDVIVDHFLSPGSCVWHFLEIVAAKKSV